MNYYKKYPNIEKSLIDYIVKNWAIEGYSVENILNNPNLVQTECSSLRYAYYRLDKAFEHLFDTFRSEFKRLFQ